MIIFIFWVRKLVYVGHVKEYCPRMQNDTTPPKEAHVLKSQNICLHYGIVHWSSAAVVKVMDLKWEMVLDESSM